MTNSNQTGFDRPYSLRSRDDSETTSLYLDYLISPDEVSVEMNASVYSARCPDFSAPRDNFINRRNYNRRPIILIFISMPYSS